MVDRELKIKAWSGLKQAEQTIRERKRDQVEDRQQDAMLDVWPCKTFGDRWNVLHGGEEQSGKDWVIADEEQLGARVGGVG